MPWLLETKSSCFELYGDDIKLVSSSAKKSIHYWICCSAICWDLNVLAATWKWSIDVDCKWLAGATCLCPTRILSKTTSLLKRNFLFIKSYKQFNLLLSSQPTSMHFLVLVFSFCQLCFGMWIKATNLMIKGWFMFCIPLFWSNTIIWFCGTTI